MVGYGRRERFLKVRSYQKLAATVADQDGSWPAASLDALRDGLARFPSDAELLKFESLRLVERENLEGALLYAERSLTANPLNLEVKIQRVRYLWELGERDRAVCSGWNILSLLQQDAPQSGRHWVGAHPSISRLAARELVEEMLHDFHRLRQAVGDGSDAGLDVDCAMVDGLAHAVESNLSVSDPRLWQGWLTVAVRQQSLATVEWLTDDSRSCRQMEDKTLLALLRHVAAWGSHLQARLFFTDFWLNRATYGSSAYLLSHTTLDGTFLFNRHGVAHFQAQIAKRAQGKAAAGDAGGGGVQGVEGVADVTPNGTTLKMAGSHALAVDFCRPFLEALIRCGGQRPQLDASSVAVILAAWGNTELMSLLIGAGYVVSSAVNWTPLQISNHPFAPRSVSLNAAFMGNAAMMRLLEQHMPTEAAAVHSLHLVRSKPQEASQSRGTSFNMTAHAAFALRASVNQDGEDQRLDRIAIRNAVTVGGGSRTVDAVRDGGGWDDGREVPIPGSTAAMAARCDFEQLDAQAVLDDPERFFREFVHRPRPVMVRDYLRTDPVVSPYAMRWSRKELLRSYGHTMWKVSPVPYSLTAVHTTLNDFVRENIDGGGAGQYAEGTLSDPDYIFASEFLSGDTDATERDVAKTFSLAPAWTQGLAFGPAQLYLGPPGSGAPWHFHHPAWNLLGYGEKAWLLTPPRQAAFSTKHASKCFVDDVPALEMNGTEPVWRCVQRAGDLLVVPDGWGHTTYNTRTSIGIAREFAWSEWSWHERDNT